jgi:membrane protease YdiL (CAAX protease family)
VSGLHTDPFGHPPELPDDPQWPIDPADAPPPAGNQAARWPMWTAFVAVITALVVGNILGGIVIGIAAAATDANTDDLPVAWSMIANGVFQLALLGTAYFFARTYGGVSAERFGWRTARFWPTLGWAVLALLAYYIFQAIWISALNLQNETDQITDKLKDDPTTATVALIAVFAVVIAPIVEETFFRGYVFTALRTSLPTGWAALITGLIFGAVHGFGSPIGFLPPLAVLGIVLCLVYWKTGSLLPCIALHLTNNAIALTVALDWTWQGLVLWAGAMLAAAGLVLPFVHVTGRVRARALPGSETPAV